GQQVVVELDIDILLLEAGKLGSHDYLLIAFRHIEIPKAPRPEVVLERGGPAAQETVEQGVELLPELRQRVRPLRGQVAALVPPQSWQHVWTSFLCLRVFGDFLPIRSAKDVPSRSDPQAAALALRIHPWAA